MPAALLEKDEVLERLMRTFRDDGYDGASLAQLSERTGLGKSSLYHHFPGGKAEMAEQVLAHLDRTLEGLFAEVASRKGAAAQRDALLAGVQAFYENGKRACLLERLAASVDRKRFGRPLKNAFAAMQGAFERVSLTAGATAAQARASAEDAVVNIEGALVVAAGTGDVRVFERTIERLRDRL